MTDPNFPNRPDHPDFWLLSQAVVDTDAQADSGEGFESIVGRLIDIPSLTYMSEQKILRVLGPTAPAPLRAAIGATWIDAFVAGMRFQHLKTTGAQDVDEDVSPDWKAAVEEVARDLDPEAFDKYPDEKAQMQARRWARRVVKAGYVKP